jgi:hypothetical protein
MCSAMLASEETIVPQSGQNYSKKAFKTNLRGRQQALAANI